MPPLIKQMFLVSAYSEIMFPCRGMVKHNKAQAEQWHLKTKGPTLSQTKASSGS